MGIKSNIASMSSRFPLALGWRWVFCREQTSQGYFLLWLQDIWSIMTRFQTLHSPLFSHVQSLHTGYTFHLSIIHSLSQRGERQSLFIHCTLSTAHYRQLRNRPMSIPWNIRTIYCSQQYGCPTNRDIKTSTIDEVPTTVTVYLIQLFIHIERLEMQWSIQSWTNERGVLN